MSKIQGDEEKGIYGVSEPAVQVLPASDGDVHVDVHTKLCEWDPSDSPPNKLHLLDRPLTRRRRWRPA